MKVCRLALSVGAGVLLLAGLTRAADPTPPGERVKTPAARDAAAVAAVIDRMLDKRLAEGKVPASPVASDGEFLRRVTLDITGRIPTPQQTTLFLNSSDPDKRRKLIDELLTNPNYGQHFSILWSDLIVNRDDANRVLNAAPFKKWLADSFNENRSWDKMVHDLLLSSGTVEENAAAMFYVANRDMNRLVPSRVVGATGNLFMGIQLQCAECHNHMYIREWKQTDFWGVAAFFNNTRATGGRMGQQNTPVSIAEGAAPAAGQRRPGMGFGGPTVRGPKIEIPDATDPRRRTGKIVNAKFFQGEEPKLEDAKPYRPAFAEWLVSTDNKYFAPAAVNRLWAKFFARGFVNPIDDMYDGNAPSHPELLQTLSNEFKASGFDLKHLIRCVCNTQAYQRTSKPLKENAEDTALFSHMTVKVMDAEVLYDSLCTALGTPELRTATAFGGRGFGGGPPGGGGGARQAFVRFFSTKEEGDDGTEMGFGVPQFLRLMNSRPFNEGGALIDAMVKEEMTPDEAIEVLFLRTLSRRPTQDEVQKFSAYLAKRPDPKAGLTGVLWVLVNSAEFVCVR